MRAAADAGSAPTDQHKQFEGNVMKLVRFGPAGKEKPGLIDQSGRIRDLSGLVADIAGPALSKDKLGEIARIETDRLPLVPAGTRLGPCVGHVGNFIAVGLNFADHAAETGATPPVEPILFNKAPSCIVGPNDDVMIPKGSVKTDWEVELAIVIGRSGSYIPEERSLDWVAGFCICNDVSERAYQTEGTGQWMKGKGCPTFGPLGPWLVTTDEIADVQKLGMWLDVNGERAQTGTTATMIFGVQHLASDISRFLRLEPGDVITTGTPPGVGMGMKPPKYLKPGDKMRLGIDGLGVQEQRVVEWRD
jgi:2-keto-4-pentenoate hydratase/2-oxohepta-3-ene-1,7-dioic acid hydratase in catechol pathway